MLGALLLAGSAAVWMHSLRAREQGLRQDSVLHLEPSPVRAVEEPSAAARAGASRAEAGGADVQVRDRAYQLSVLTTDANGAPVAEVSVHALRADESILLGSTDAEGRFAAPVELPQTLYFRHPDYVAESVELSTPPAGALHVVLMPGGLIRGVLEVVDGSAPPAGALVTAMPAHDHSPRGARGRPSSANPRMIVAEPDTAGRFELRGLAHDSAYVLRAGAPGWMAADRAIGARAGDEGLVLTLKPLYAFRIALTEEDGSPLRGDSRASVLGGTTWRSLDDRLEDVSERLDDLHLAGLDLRTAERWDERAFVYASDLVAERAGPVLFHVEILGYRPTRERIWAERVRSAAIELAQLRLSSDLNGFGELRVRFSSLAPLPPGLGDLPLGSLELLAEGGGRGTRAVQLEVRQGGTHVLPAGNYAWRFHAPAKLYQLPACGAERASIRIDAGEVAEILVDAAELGGVRFELPRAGGTLHVGQAILRFALRGRGEKTTWQHLEFPTSPYAVFGIPPGRWEVAAITGTEFHPPGAEEYHGRVEVTAGEWTTAVLVERRTERR